MKWKAALASAAIVLATIAASAVPARAAEPDWSQAPTDPNQRFRFVEDGELTTASGLPTYEWIPQGFQGKPRGMVLLLHGLTLHGRRYTVVGKAFASGNFYAVACDMRGFGKCYHDSDHSYCQGGNCRRDKDCKARVNHKKTYGELVEIARLMKKKYPDVPLVAVGESLGATPAVRLAGEHPELVDALILSGPAVRVNPMMILAPSAMIAGLRGLIIDPKFNVKMSYFMQQRVSADPRIVKEMEDDPLMRTKLTIRDLLETDAYVAKTLRYARKIAAETPVLVLQGSQDLCVLPKHVVNLSQNIRSDDQTLRWFDHYSHLLLETTYIQPATIDSIVTWIDDHEAEHKSRMQVVDNELRQLGARDL